MINIKKLTSILLICALIIGIIGLNTNKSEAMGFNGKVIKILAKYSYHQGLCYKNWWTRDLNGYNKWATLYNQKGDCERRRGCEGSHEQHSAVFNTRNSMQKFGYNQVKDICHKNCKYGF